MSFACINHRLNRKSHAGFYDFASTFCAKVQYAWFFMKLFSNTVTTVFSHDRKARLFCMLLNGGANVTKMRARFHLFNAYKKTFMRNANEPFCHDRWFADHKHFARITMIAIFDNGNINIENIAIF